jgi:pimeloyl-ACP methyl ester carboxylesterase
MVIKNGYDNESKAKSIKAPTLLIHGKKDELIKPDHSVKLFSKIELTRPSAREG